MQPNTIRDKNKPKLIGYNPLFPERPPPSATAHFMNKP